MVERWNSCTEDALRACGAGHDRFSHLPWVLPHKDSGHSPAEAISGGQMVLLGEFLSTPESPPDAFLWSMSTATAAGFQTLHHVGPASPPSLPEELLSADMLCVRTNNQWLPLAPFYAGPCKVVKCSLWYFKLQLRDQVEMVSTNCLKAARVAPDTPAALLPQRGRPPLTTPPPPSVTTLPRKHARFHLPA